MCQYKNRVLCTNYINFMDRERCVIRRLQKEDYYRGFPVLLSQLTEVGEFTYEEFKVQFKALKSEVYVIDFDGLIIACGTLMVEPKFIHRLSSVGHIEDIVVDKVYRGWGLGRWIVQHLTNLAKDKGCYKVILDCSEENVGFYEKVGYELKGVEMAVYF